MKKNVLLILITLIISIFQNNYFLNTKNINDLNDMFNTEIKGTKNNKLNITNQQYLPLNYQGYYFNWNENDTSTNNVNVGIFNNKNDNESYLISNYGVFTNLKYKINNFIRIDDSTGIANIEYYQDANNNLEFSNKNFVVSLKNNTFIINSAPINTANNDFTIINNTDPNNVYLVSSGIGLDLIVINKKDLSTTTTNLIPPYQNKGYSPTCFYKLGLNSGIFLNDIGKYEYLNNITSTMTNKNLNYLGDYHFRKNLALVNNNNSFILRTNVGKLLYYNISDNNVTYQFTFQKRSLVTNFVYNIDSNFFILNSSDQNYTNNFGIPLLIKINDWNNPIQIQMPNTLKKISMLNNSGVYIDGDNNAYTIKIDSSFDSSPNFNLNKIGVFNNYQVINEKLGFAQLDDYNNILFSFTNNSYWNYKNGINFSALSSTTKTNFLNNNIAITNPNINYENTFVANGPVKLSINNSALISLTINNDTIINSTNINYDFNNNGTYNLAILYENNIKLNYQLIIGNFEKPNISLEAQKTSKQNVLKYVGTTNNQLYDIEVINNFLVSGYFQVNFDQDKIKTITNTELVAYNNQNLVTKSIIGLNNQDDIFPPIKKQIPDFSLSFLYSINITNLLNEKYTYFLGFSSTENNLPLNKFWDTTQGKNLWSQAIQHNYTTTQLNNMDANAITNLVNIANNWKIIKVQGTILVYIIITISLLSIIIIFFSFGYNEYLNKKIKDKKIKKILLVD